MGGRVVLVYDEAYQAYRHADWHPLQPRRVKLAVELMRARGLVDPASGTAAMISPRIATDAEVGRIHDAGYIELVKRLGHGDELEEWEVERAVVAGFGSDDNPVFDSMHEASALIAGGSLEAARAVHEGEALHSFNPAGGLHHAMQSRASGFCVYNDVAIACAYLADLGHRVACVDIDVHHGDGTEAAFYADPNVLTVSLHEYRRGFFPGTGLPDETGVGAGKGTNANLPLPPYTWDAPWIAAFLGTVPALLRDFRPTVLVTQDGCDTHLLDPLGELSCSTAIWPVIGSTFHALAHELCEGRWVALGGGGYAIEEVVPRAWSLLLGEMVERPELVADLVDPEPFPPVPEAQERIRPAIDTAVAALFRSLAGDVTG